MARAIVVLSPLLHHCTKDVVIIHEESPDGLISLATGHLHDLADASFSDANERVLWLWSLIVVTHVVVIGLLQLEVLHFIVISVDSVVVEHILICLVLVLAFDFFISINFSKQIYLLI